MKVSRGGESASDRTFQSEPKRSLNDMMKRGNYYTHDSPDVDED